MADSIPFVTLTDPSRLAEEVAKLKASGGGVLVLSGGSYPVNADLTVDASITLNFMNGAKLNIAAGRTLTLNGKIEAGITQIFAGDGQIKGDPQVKEFYPQWFGALGNGRNDDTKGIQNAINTAASVGGTVVFPQAAYIASTIYLKSGIRLSGEKGAVLQSASTSFPDTLFTGSGIFSLEIENLEGKISFDLSSSSDFTIQQLHITENAGNWAFTACTNGMILNNRIINTKNTTERIIYLSGCTDVLVQGNRIKNKTLFNNVEGNLNTGINASSSKYCRIMNNHIENCGGQGITFDTNIGFTAAADRKCYSNLAAGNIVIGNGQEGITAFASSQYETYDITITGNICINNRYDGIELWGVRQCIVDSNSISAPAVKDYSFGAVNIYASKDIIVSGNAIDNVPTSGIATVNGSNYPEPKCSNIILTNNRIQNWNYQDMNPATNHDQICAINLFGADFTVVQGNLILDTRGGRKYGVKAISVVQGRHHIQGNVNPSNLAVDDHVEADMSWAGRQIAERLPMLRMSQLQGDVNNGSASGIDPGSVWYNANKFALFFKGYEKAMLTPMIVDETSTSGFPSADYAPGYMHYQNQTGRLFFRGKTSSSSGKYTEFVLKDKFINLKRSTEVTKKPVEGDTYYDPVKKKPVYFDGTNWRDYAGNIVSVNP
ncbi:right-handed parallel beta-helix repeat-containing protein [Paenibacillus sp. SAF-054]|uniref:right-handed parallel beta-helix repeat-containing protein n=1 Tax=unclassified Paenibacillus TaxID=185978 RepID=UPI003F7EC22C